MCAWNLCSDSSSAQSSSNEAAGFREWRHEADHSLRALHPFGSESPVLIGRDVSRCGVVVQHGAVSRIHAAVFYSTASKIKTSKLLRVFEDAEGDELAIYLVDLQSTLGSEVNGMSIDAGVCYSLLGIP